MHARIDRRQLLSGSLALAVGASFPAIARGQQATPIAVESADWPLYGRDLSGDKAIIGNGITGNTVQHLATRWQAPVGGPVSATPVIAAGVAYVGSYDGNLYALDLTDGQSIWTYASGAAVMEPNLQIPLGIPGSAAYDDGMVFVGDSAATVHAIDAMSGSARWKTRVESAANACIWSSPVVAGDRLYVGVASIAKEVGFRGSVVALDRNSGSVVWQNYMVPEGADGAGVFAVPAIDRLRGLLYVGTQNAYSANPAPYGHPISIVALDLASGDLKWAFSATGDLSAAPTDDIGFSASPNLFSVEIGGATRDLVGEGQKSGVYYALDRDTGELVWKTTVSPAGFLGGMEGTSAAAGGVIAVPATNWPNFDGPAAGMVTALDAATGRRLWTAEQNAPAASPAAITDDLVLHAGLDGVLHAYGLLDGAELGSWDLGASVSGGIAAANGVMVLGAATPAFAPFVKAGSTIQAFAIGAEATPVPDTNEPVPSPVASPAA